MEPDPDPVSDFGYTCSTLSRLIQPYANEIQYIGALHLDPSPSHEAPPGCDDLQTERSPQRDHSQARRIEDIKLCPIDAESTAPCFTCTSYPLYTPLCNPAASQSKKHTHMQRQIHASPVPWYLNLSLAAKLSSSLPFSLFASP
jgi:hypothetical protein